MVNMTADMTGASPGAQIMIATVPNLRDLGGWPTPDGRVRYGLLFRSAEFSDLQGGDAAAFARLGIRSVYDLRTQAERGQQPNKVPPGTEYVVLDILKDSSQAGAAQLLAVLADPAAAEAMLGDGKAVNLFKDSYRELITLPSALAGYRQLFSAIAEDERTPALFHCTTGKDRTGWAAAAILLLLGVSNDDVFADYLLTNDQLLPALQPVLDQFKSIGGDPELLKPVAGVQREYLETALDEMQSRYKTIDGYFSQGLALETATIGKLRAKLIGS
jgi:protein-tyrosine phosphatase